MTNIQHDIVASNRSIEEWRSLQSDTDRAYENIVSLVASIDPADPAWITIASEDQLQKQWTDLHALVVSVFTNIALLSNTNQASFGDGNIGSNSPASFTDRFPLFGVPCAIKDNIDVAGFPTTAACPKFAYTPKSDAVIVSLLRNAGAIIVGKTNLDQFATGLVGTRSPYGRPSSVYSPNHVPGGSSSGSAVVVANGTVPFSLGTDTAGSGRVPAMLNNLVGLKPTLGIFSATGVVPACKSLDCVSILTNNVNDAQLIFSIVAQYDPSYGYARQLPSNAVQSYFTLSKKPRFAIPSNPRWFGEEENAQLYERAIERLSSQVDIERVNFDVLYDMAALLYEGPWVAERYSAVRKIITENPEDMNPVVRQIISKAERFSAADFFDAEYTRKDMLKKIERQFGSFDGLIVPTAPLNPTFAQVDSDPIAVNSCQGTYTNFVNLADMSAIAIPAGFRSDGLPFGITLIGKAFDDCALADLAKKFLGESTSDAGSSNNLTDETVDVCVVGGHMSNMALNWQLTSLDATLVFATTTSPNYLLYKLPSDGDAPLRPGLRRLENGGKHIECEVWKMTKANLGTLVTMVPPPLAIGSVELQDGSWVKGFVCEEIGYIDNRAVNISAFGGWRSYLDSVAGENAIKESIVPASAEAQAPEAKTSHSKAPFHTVLVANRGEIAVRIIKTLKKLGVTAVAIYSESDAFAEHVRLADKVVALGGNSASDTYLNIDKIIEAAKNTSAEAIIPGYGFLSENAEFALACASNDIVFVGPDADSIRRLGLKHSAREIAAHAHVPIVPGSGLLGTVSEALDAAERIGFPVMIKSTAGGGGIGIAKVDKKEDVEQAFLTIQHQGNQFFKDTGVFIEKFVANSRHVEVQVVGDGLGWAIAVGERDCSLQRRNQKIIEETPAPNLPRNVRAEMHAAAERLCASIFYKNVGTVEYIYDDDTKEFYFLEVNTRLQVEHPITETVHEVDLVEWMLRVASGDVSFLRTYNKHLTPNGSAIEIRVYAESPLRGFAPSTGQITEVKFPTWARVDTWISKGTRVSSEYDPTLAKIIVHGKTRDEAIRLCLKALDETLISGVETNLGYVKEVLSTKVFANATMTTRFLDTTFAFNPQAFEVLAPGNHTTVQDYPARLGLWHIGVPPSGPMDDFALRVANRLVGNTPEAAALECTIAGPELLFHYDSVIAVAGGDFPVEVDGQSVGSWKAHYVKAGSRVKIGKATKGCRTYFAIRGGIDVPKYLGSRSTFVPAAFGGLNGSILKRGDVVSVSSMTALNTDPVAEFPASSIPNYDGIWNVGVTVGPHGCPDFFKEEYLEEFFSADWKVHYNSNRWGVRLTGPKPKWARQDGGEAGLHPSNAHDYVYSLGAINFTGDEPVVLTCDGPSLGGFVCPAVVIESELWKIGQARPGDTIRFFPVTIEDAIDMGQALLNRINGIEEAPKDTAQVDIFNCVLCSKDVGPISVTVRQAGDRYVLVELGDNIMDLNLTYAIDVLISSLSQADGVIEMSRGVRSVLVEFDASRVFQSTLVDKIYAEAKLIEIPKNWKHKSRLIRLPLAFEDKKTLAAVERYKETIRDTAPWLPNNVDFLKEVNGLESREEVRDVLYRARFLVLGLGDVFLGAPCAVPLDPRHRLVGTKYNPSRSYTPNGTVGIGGMYMCIYTMDSPGGYQLVGRTVPIWDKLMLNDAQKDHPWLLNPFDQIEYYPVTEDELEVYCRQVENGVYEMQIEDTIFDYGEYATWLEDNSQSIRDHQAKQQRDYAEIAKLLQADREVATEVPSAEPQVYSENAVFAYADVTGRFWKACVKEGDIVTQGQPVVILEAMKTEIVIGATGNGKVTHICHKNGDLVEMGSIVAVIE